MKKVPEYILLFKDSVLEDDKTSVRSEREQAFLRTTIAFFFFVYLAISAVISDTVNTLWINGIWLFMSFYLVISIGIFGSTFIWSNSSWVRRFFGILFDIGSFSYGLILTDELGAPWFAVYLWVIFGNTIRYGGFYLWLSTLVSVAGFSVVLLLSDYWQNQVSLGIGLLISLIVLPLYAGSLVRRVRMEQARAERANKSKSDFLANMSHEIRTPMNGVLGFINLLGKTELNSLQQEYLDTIETSASSLLVIINDILDLSKLEAGKLVLEHELFSLQDCVDNTIALLAPLAHKKRIELVAQVYSDVPDQLQGDQTRISQIIINLVSNAIKFTSEGEVVLRVMLEEDDYAGVKLAVSVTDTGIGIDPDQQSCIFSAFSQAGSAKNTIAGTGLGLTICKRLVTAMHGSIQLSSKPGEGSCFEVTITLRRGSLPDSTAIHGSNFSGMHIMLIEPHRSSRIVVQNQLLELGMKVTVVHAYQEAASASQDSIELVVAGISGRDLSKDSLVKQLVEILCQINQPVLLLAGSSSHQDCQKFKRCQFITCISKPMRHTMLEEALTKLLHMKQPVSAEYPLQGKLTDSWLDGTNVLVVDDNSINLKLMKYLLGNYGARTFTASNGEDAVAIAKTYQLDLILMDIHMPGTNGLQAAAKIRMQTDNEHVPIVALTADAMQHNKEEIIHHGFDGYLIKPTDEAKLKSTLIHLLLDDQKDMKSSDIIKQSSKLGSNDNRKELPIRDYVTAKRIAGNSASVADELFSNLLDSLRTSLSRMRSLHACNEWADLWHEVHKLQGAASVCSTPALLHAIVRLEAVIKSKNWEKVLEELICLEHELKRLTNTVDVL